MTSQDGTPPSSPPPTGVGANDNAASLPRIRSPERPTSRSARPFSEVNLPFRRSNASLSAIFASTASLNSAKRASSPIISLPSNSTSQESAFATNQLPKDPLDDSNPYRTTIIRSFIPHIAVLPSQDTEELLQQKGFPGGLLQILRPYGENVQGKVTIRDSNGASKSWEDFAIRFVRLKDGLEGPRAPEQKSVDSRPQNINGYLDQYLPETSARLRTGGDTAFIEDLVGKHLAYYEAQYNPEEEDNFIQEASSTNKDTTFVSAFHLLYLRRLLSGFPLSPHETFSHPVACVIGISSRNPDPIEELRQLYADTSTGDYRLPQWVNNDYLRYYVLVHDEEHDDVQRSMSLFEQMKRHFGIHCYLLRIRSTQCVPSDEGSTPLPPCEWLSAAEELAEIEKRESEGDDGSFGPCLFESDEASIRSFVRELVTQSVIPVMERLCATWNDQIASRKRSIGGRFLSLSKKWTFGSSRSSSSSTTASNSSGSNYDSVQGCYKPDSPEALLRKLADYAFMLRDFKLAQSTYELVRADYSNDKAWKYYAGANEMSVITTLLTMQPLTAKSKSESIDQMLDTAIYSYTTRCAANFYALRTLAVCIELLSMRGGSGADDASRWACRISELDLVGLVGHALYAERIAACFSSRKGTGSRHWGSRRRKSALWNVIATQDWIKLERNKQAERCLTEAFKMYHINPKDASFLAFDSMRIVLEDLSDAVLDRKGTIEAFAGVEEPMMTFDPPSPVMKTDEPLSAEKPDIKKHRHKGSLIGMSTGPDLVAMTQPPELGRSKS